jgi:precorrin-6B methylase 2
MQTKKWCVENMAKDWNCLDIGANVGIYTALFCQLCPHGTIWAFEPTETVEMRRQNCSQFTNLKAKFNYGRSTNLIKNYLQGRLLEQLFSNQENLNIIHIILHHLIK